MKRARGKRGKETKLQLFHRNSGKVGIFGARRKREKEVERKSEKGNQNVVLTRFSLRGARRGEARRGKRNFEDRVYTGKLPAELKATFCKKPTG